MARSRTTWQRGQSGNPAGTGLKLKLAQGYAEESIRTPGRLMAAPAGSDIAQAGGLACSTRIRR